MPVRTPGYPLTPGSKNASMSGARRYSVKSSSNLKREQPFDGESPAYLAQTRKAAKVKRKSLDRRSSGMQKDLGSPDTESRVFEDSDFKSWSKNGIEHNAIFRRPKEFKRNEEIAESIHNLMHRHGPDEQNDRQLGKVYILEHRDWKGYVKIGFTRQLEKRRQELARAIGCELPDLVFVEVFSNNDKVPHFSRLEKFMHSELDNHRYLLEVVQSPSISASGGGTLPTELPNRDDTTEDPLLIDAFQLGQEIQTESIDESEEEEVKIDQSPKRGRIAGHKEWFKIEKGLAKKVMHHWGRWLTESRPYNSDGVLDSYWQQKAMPTFVEQQPAWRKVVNAVTPGLFSLMDRPVVEQEEIMNTTESDLLLSDLSWWKQAVGLVSWGEGRRNRRPGNQNPVEEDDNGDANPRMDRDQPVQPQPRSRQIVHNPEHWRIWLQPSYAAKLFFESQRPRLWDSRTRIPSPRDRLMTLRWTGPLHLGYLLYAWWYGGYFVIVLLSLFIATHFFPLGF